MDTKQAQAGPKALVSAEEGGDFTLAKLLGNCALGQIRVDRQERRQETIEKKRQFSEKTGTCTAR